tara:strand:- start:1028 stop:1279 length:252 start_codon:yes stop_codon:yes gene_type:complete
MAGGLVLGQLIPGVLDNFGNIAAVFSNNIREDNIALAQAQSEGYASALALQNAQKDQKKPNYTNYIIIGVVVLVVIYLLKRKK